jgi:3-hydroxy acid dehydrogenase / malonic semialdehyde reductase
LLYKTALISGASSGIGWATAKCLADEGLNVILLARREDKLKELAQQLNKKVRSFIVVADVTDLDNLQQQLDQLPTEFSNPDVLINNAGAAIGLDTAQEANWQDWHNMIDLNCTGLAFLTHYVLPKMVNNNRGHIINLGSIAGSYPYRGGNVYGATKAFVEQFTLNLKADLLGTLVRVTSLEPGMVAESEFSLVRFKGDTDAVKNVYSGIRAMNPDDIAQTISWILNQPPHVNINRIEMMCVDQAPSRTAFFKDGKIV